ncbi:MAG: saccharopine dehydrogenase family protein, partial [Gammaproteobacteria bacterium]
MTDNAREFDVLVWGASGFTGRLVAEYLLATYGADGPVRWALAGRSEPRLTAVRDALGPQAASLPIRVAAIDDPAGLAALVASTRVVCTTVGPYALYGSPLVAACVAEGTHCCDLTGEVHWMRRMIDQHHDAARASGARIVHTCGFDSIPSDIGTWHLQETLRARHGAP